MKESMNRWLHSYKSRRTSGEIEMSQLLQVRPDLQGLSWDEIRSFPVPQLGEGMTMGKSFSMLKKSWRSYKLYRKDGMPAPDLAMRILKIQYSLGLPLSEFLELDQRWVEGELNRSSDDEQLSPLDLQLRKEEEQDAGLVEIGFDNDEEMSDEERRLEQELMAEERAEALADQDKDELNYHRLKSWTMVRLYK